jgi:oligopeptide/dipeptide ABC transporter ATP-binding protein
LKGAELSTISGAPPNVSKRIDGCLFAPGCQFAQEKCVASKIVLKEVAPGHSSACLRIQLGEIELAPASMREGTSK